MTNEPGDSIASAKGGGGSREYMSDFARGRTDIHCESCGLNMRRDPDFGTEADGGHSERYCSVCFRDGKFVHEASTAEAFLAAAVEDLAAWRKQSTGKTKLQLGKELRKLPRWK